jgi:hypothetical protein
MERCAYCGQYRAVSVMVEVLMFGGSDVGVPALVCATSCEEDDQDWFQI